MRFLKIGLFVFGLCFGAVSAFAESAPDSWLQFLAQTKEEMLERGIHEEVWEKTYGKNTYYHPKPEVLQKDKKQAEFVLSSEDYLERLLNAKRVAKTRHQYTEMKKKYADIEKKYQVPLSYLVAFWAVETDFGQNKGQYLLADSLLNLAADHRRSKFFKNELYHFLKIVQDHHLDPQNLYGSWAGAMGHFQFMPSTYEAYAVDWDRDGFADIWNSVPDAVASAANYLHQLGLKPDEPWGTEVVLPWNFDFDEVGLSESNTIKQWQKKDLRLVDGKKLQFDKALKASVIVPDGRRGRSYLVFRNFRKIMIWNRSQNYALAVGMLSDVATNHKPFNFAASLHQFKPTSEEVAFIQRFANQILKTKLKVDGKLGVNTKAAIKKLQTTAGLPADGYPDYRFISKLKNYDPAQGFEVPLPPRKVKK